MQTLPPACETLFHSWADRRRPAVSYRSLEKLFTQSQPLSTCCLCFYTHRTTLCSASRSPYLVVYFGDLFTSERSHLPSSNIGLMDYLCHMYRISPLIKRYFKLSPKVDDFYLTYFTISDHSTIAPLRVGTG